MIRIDLNEGFMKLWRVSTEHDHIVGLHDVTMTQELGVGLVMLKHENCAIVMPWDWVETKRTMHVNLTFKWDKHDSESKS